MIIGKWKETSGDMPTIHFQEINSKVLERVIEYFGYKRRYENTAPPIPKFDVSFDDAISLLMAAHFLDV